VRIFNTYGPRMRLNEREGGPGLYQSGRSKNKPLTVFGEGKTDPQFLCYVSDLIEGIYRLMKQFPSANLSISVTPMK